MNMAELNLLLSEAVSGCSDYGMICVLGVTRLTSRLVYDFVRKKSLEICVMHTLSFFGICFSFACPKILKKLAAANRVCKHARLAKQIVMATAHV